ncbi:MAG: phage portal protein [Mogibacterium sp.]|nr:phage portal protein [Mogibacterium sp.]
MINLTVPNRVYGLGPEEQGMLEDLVNIFNYHQSKNEIKAKHYEGNIPLRDVNLGIALPDELKKLEIGCAWGAKTVDVLAARSMFDGFVGVEGAETSELDEIIQGNRLLSEYTKACRDELEFGCTFATLSADKAVKCRIRFHPPSTAAARWNGQKGRIDCGFAIIDTVKDESESRSGLWRPSLINLYTDTAVWVIKIDSYTWTATEHKHMMGRPLMEPLVWNATSNKPFGRSRLKEPIRRLIQSYVRTIANATIGLEFSTAPQKYLLGVSNKQYETLINQKFRQYVGSVLFSTRDPNTGETPEFGQLPQGNIEPHVQMMRILATQFSAATGLTVTDTGVVNDANPTSSDAILAQSQTLVAMAEELNAGNGESLRTIAIMALAIANNTTIEALSDEQKGIVAHFKNPAMPSIAATSDAAIKIASAREDFASTDVFLEMIGFDQADIRRIKAQEQRARGLSLIGEIELEESEELADETNS